MNARKKKIVIATSGWVFIGQYDDSSTSVTITDASIIRIWGTTKGLGEIAFSGPTKSTVLDPCGTVTLPISSVVACIDCKV
jgi:hypothetical protein